MLARTSRRGWPASREIKLTNAGAGWLKYSSLPHGANGSKAVNWITILVRNQAQEIGITNSGLDGNEIFQLV